MFSVCRASVLMRQRLKHAHRSQQTRLVHHRHALRHDWRGLDASQRRRLLQLQPVDRKPGVAFVEVCITDEPSQRASAGTQNRDACARAMHLQKPRHSSLLRVDTASALPHRFNVPAGSVSRVIKTMATVSHTRSEHSATDTSAHASSSARMSSSLRSGAWSANAVHGYVRRGVKSGRVSRRVVQIAAFVGACLNPSSNTVMQPSTSARSALL